MEGLYSLSGRCLSLEFPLEGWVLIVSLVLNGVQRTFLDQHVLELRHGSFYWFIGADPYC